MSTQFVDLADLADWYGAPLPSDEQAEKLLEAAEDEIRAEFARAGRDLAADVGSGRVSRIALESVVCELTCAALRNPTGARSGSTTRTEGPFTETSSFTLSESARGEVGLTDRQRRKLGLNPDGAFTINGSRRHRHRGRRPCDVERVRP